MVDLITNQQLNNMKLVGANKYLTRRDQIGDEVE